MKDVTRLRRFLYAAVFATPLACSGGAGSTRGAGEPTVKLPPDAGTGAVVADGRSGVLRTPPDNCSRGQWCGPPLRVKPFVGDGVSVKLGCPTDVIDPDGTTFSWSEKATQEARAAGDADSCCYDYVARCHDERVIEGRPLFDGGEARVALLRRGAPGARAWFGRAAARFATAAPADAALPAALRAALADAWAADALAEHASVASFSRASLELQAIAAPPALLLRLHRAALDEIRHAERCFALASRYALAPLGPGALAAPAARALTPAGVATTTFFEGCVAETIAALRAARALSACEDPATRTLLRGIARDEARHAALAWGTLSAFQRDDLVELFRVSAQSSQTYRPGDGAADGAGDGADGRADDAAGAFAAGEFDDDPRWAAHGRLTLAAQRIATRDAWTQVIQPLLAELERSSAAVTPNDAFAEHPTSPANP